VNPTDWAKIEDSENFSAYADLPRKRKPIMPPADPNDFLMSGAGHVHEEDPDPDEVPFITARYDGRCSACEQWHIIAGDTRIRADGFGGWESEECAW
jgi:hypothetical protein